MLLLILFAPIVAAIADFVRRAGATNCNRRRHDRADRRRAAPLLIRYRRCWVSIRYRMDHHADWGWRFALGIDGLSLIMLLLTAIVTSPRSGSPRKSRATRGAFYSCLLFISAGAIGAFASLDLVLLLRVSRARAHPDISAHRNLGQRQPASRRMESHDLPRDRQFHFAARLDPALSQFAASIAQF